MSHKMIQILPSEANVCVFRNVERWRMDDGALLCVNVVRIESLWSKGEVNIEEMDKESGIQNPIL